MIKKINKLVGLKKTDFDEYVSNKIIVQDLKTWEKPAPKLQTKKEVKAIETPTEELKQ